MKTSALLATVLLGALTTSVALAQPPGGFGGGPPGGGFGGGRRGGPRELTAAGAPVEAYAGAIKLNDKQKGQIKAIQDQLKAEREKIFPRPGGPGGPPGGGRPGGPPGGFGGGGFNMEAMRANFEKLRASEEKANKDINALLNDSQKKALPGVLKGLTPLRDAGIPLELAASLKLTEAQKTQIGDAVNKVRASAPPPGAGGGGFGGFGAMREMREKMHSAALQVLNADQKRQVDAWEKAHPRPQFGGFGGGRGR